MRSGSSKWSPIYCNDNQFAPLKHRGIHGRRFPTVDILLRHSASALTKLKCDKEHSLRALLCPWLCSESSNTPVDTVHRKWEFSQVEAIKVIASCQEGPSGAGARIWRLRDWLLNLLEIYQDFSNSIEFLLLVETMASVMIAWFSVYVIYYSASVSRLHSWHGEMETWFMYAVPVVATTGLFTLGNCGETLGQNVWSFLDIFLK